MSSFLPPFISTFQFPFFDKFIRCCHFQMIPLTSDLLFLPPPTPPLYDADCHSCPVVANVILLPMAAKCHHRQINKVRDGFVSLLTAQAKNENTNKKEIKKERKKERKQNGKIDTFFLLTFFWIILLHTHPLPSPLTI